MLRYVLLELSLLILVVRQVTRLVLESIDADFDLSRHHQYWLVALKHDLRITMEYFKLLKAHAVPYGIGDFEELYLSLIEVSHQYYTCLNSPMQLQTKDSIN